MTYPHKSINFYLVLNLYLVLWTYVVIKAHSVMFNTCLGIKSAHNYYVFFILAFKD